MAKRNSSNQDYTNNADGWDLTGGTTGRKLTVTGADITLTGSGTAVHTFPATTSTLARTDAGQTFTGVNVFTSPKIITDISDTNGNELFKFTATGSAVNELTLANAATGGNPSLTASGGDSNVGIDFLAKGTGTFNFKGNSTQQATIKLFEDTDNGTNSVAIKTPASLAADYTLTLPVDDGNANQVLTTDGSGVLSWSTPSSGGGFSQLARVVLSGTAASISTGTFTAKRYLKVYVYLMDKSTTIQASLRTNNISTSTYGWGYTENGAAASTGSTQAQINLGSANNQDCMYSLNFSSIGTWRQVMNGTGNKFTATSASEVITLAGVQQSTAQITQIDILADTGTFGIGSEIVVFGSD